MLIAPDKLNYTQIRFLPILNRIMLQSCLPTSTYSNKTGLCEYWIICHIWKKLR